LGVVYEGSLELTNRDAYFDNVKLMLIITVVVGHIIEPLIGTSHSLKSLYLFIYFFHMPVFVFVSGYFSKNISSGDHANKVISKLVIPYFIFESIYSIFDYWIFKRETLVYSYFTPYWILWFLFSMIIWKVVLPYIIEVRYALVVSIILAILVGYTNDVGYYFSLSRTFVFFPFFLVGYYFNKQYLDMLFTKPIRIMSVAFILFVIILIYYFGQDFKQQWLYGSYSYESLGHKEWYAGIYRVGIFTLTVIISTCVLTLIPRRNLSLISNMGGRTIYVYLLHGFIMKFLIYLDIYKRINTTFEKASLILLGIVLAIILSTPFAPKLIKLFIKPIITRISNKRECYKI
jgi:fucose 4-O-acetylase-like acetyltransferase